MMNRMRRTNFLKIQGNEEQDDFLEDIIIDNGQASEMADIYTNIVNSMMDAFASIISNNLGRTVQRLTVITIVLTLPMVISKLLRDEHSPSHARGWTNLVMAILDAVIGRFPSASLVFLVLFSS